MGFFRSLRGKLIAATVFAEFLVVLLLLWNGVRLLDEHLVAQFEERRESTSLLLQSALTGPVVERDYGSLHDVLQACAALRGIRYLRVFDESGQVLASAGRLGDVLPGTGPDAGGVAQDVVADLEIGGHRFGRVQYGLDTRFLREARDEVVTQTLLIGGVGLAGSALLLAALGLWLTRHLRRLSQASHRLAEGRSAPPLPESRDGDVGELTSNFNRMAKSLAERMNDLQDSEFEQRTLARNLKAERARLHALLSSMRQGLLFVSPQQEVIYVNPAFLALWHLEDAPVVPGMPIADLTAEILLHQDGLQAYRRQPLFAEPALACEYVLEDGRVVTQSSVPVLNVRGRNEAPADTQEAGRLWIFEDVTAERQNAERLRYLAERDPLTGLHNRHRFEAELQRMVLNHDRDPRAEAALLYFDLDEFKTINDIYGHRAGDSVLLRIASAVGELVRGNETLARLGGDEFALIANDADPQSVQALAERILTTVSQQVFQFGDRKLRLTASLGAALFPAHAATPDELVARADAAMYQAKEAGKNGWRLYRPESDSARQLLAQLSMGDRLRSALADEGFVLYFQGVYETLSGRLCHMEALVRLLDPECPGTVLSPAQFIPVAERTGLIVDIDRWVLRQAIDKLAREPDCPPVAVNISARSFDDPHLPAFIVGTLAQRGVAPHRLLVELTETAALSNIQDTEIFIHSLRQAGCSVCLDDFGVGFSSFAYLKHFEADVLKIDGMFIRNLVTDHADQVFVRALVQVARGLGKRTVAEFVEDGPTLALLQVFGVDMAQGYHYGRPAPELPSRQM